MLLRQFFDYESNTYTYLLATDNNNAIIIDAVKEKLDFYLQTLKELNLTLKICLDTHVHADHITASGLLQKATNCKIYMGELAKVPASVVRLKDNDKIILDNIALTAIYTPGHTDDSYCFYDDDKVFTGDTLLIKRTGRTDFQNGSSEAQYDSIFNKLLKLPDNLLVYPAHDYNGVLCSTIREEKLFNPRLQVKSKAEYVELMNNLNLPNPKQIEKAVPANQKLGLS